MRGMGTLINTGLVVAGSGAGLLIGKHITDKMRETVVQVVGLVTLALGLRDAFTTHNMVFPLVGMVFGAIIGEILRIDHRFEQLGHVIQRRFSRTDKEHENTFAKGFATASLLFFIGPMTILGAMQDGAGRTPQLYIIKGTLDGFISIIFTAMYGIGVMFSAVSVFVTQGILTIFGTGLDSLLDDRMRLEMFAAGGIAVAAIGLNLLDIKKIRLGSLLPGLVITPILVSVFAK